MINANEGILVPLIVFSSFVIALGMLLFYQYAKKRAFLGLIEKAIKTREDLTPDVIKAIAGQLYASNRDLRRGLFALLLGLAICGFSVAVDFPHRGNIDLNDALYGIALFPLLSGIGYLLLHLFEKQ
ncbi:DUF6249 domain-containing protein [Bowmanella dokdonensis]|uniref:DUF6249 domain-containing protein n=1 Tax=Bowmanella dokdonensis TaxID=751969 RepID=A0A939DN70_9ALTE|nr:DUF6249 domain-containing protein [Bowmanella dokdonensis]MBN7825312.1 hypothetical protein [Bowmanella dokdonensis]